MRNLKIKNTCSISFILNYYVFIIFFISFLGNGFHIYSFIDEKINLIKRWYVHKLNLILNNSQDMYFFKYKILKFE